MNWFLRLFWQPKRDPRLVTVEREVSAAACAVNQLEVELRKIARGM